MTIPDDPGPPKDATQAEGAASAAEDEYKVGYAKPPLHSRFEAGHSGNPKGRPRHSKNLKTIVSEVTKATVAITENGKRRNVPALQALIKKQMQLALQGNLKAAAQLLAMVQMFMEEEGPALQPFDAERDKEIIASYLRQLKDDADG